MTIDPENSIGRLSAAARLSGELTVKAEPKGSDTGLLLMLTTGVVLFGACLMGAVASTARGGLLSMMLGAGALVGLGTIVVAGAGWFKARAARNRAHMSATEVSYIDPGRQIRVVSSSPNPAVIKLLRALLQGRKALPPPHGRVLGDPGDVANLRPYTAEERGKVVDDLRRREDEFDDRVLQPQKLEARIGPKDPAAGG